MKIKTITEYLEYCNTFDSRVNEALEAGWNLTKREVLIPKSKSDDFHFYYKLYAELERDD